MPAKFNDSFWTEGGLRLKMPDLACLKLDSMLYKTLLLQLNEDIGFDNTGIWLTNKERSKLKFNKFFELAIQQNVALAVTPEYSCPWTILEELLKDSKFPSLHNLWVLGMASVNPGTLKTFIDGNPGITWIYDKALLDESIESSPDKFFDPVCYLLNTNNNDEVNQRVIIVQFKNCPFGGTDAHWERDNIILGRTFYVLRNQKESARLITLICSDSLERMDLTEVQDGMFMVVPLLILHIQLNQEPFSDKYKLYRNLVFSKGSKDANKETICLNWARKVLYKVKGEDVPFNEIAGSAVYLKSTKLAKTDEQVNSNHKQGMYYTNWSQKRAHVYLFNFDEYIFLFENTKVDQAEADPSQHNRTGPRLISTYKWDNDSWTQQRNRVDDGFYELVSAVEHQKGELTCLTDNQNFLEVERMVQLTAGEIDIRKDWYTISNLVSFVIDDAELNDRVTFAQQDIKAKIDARKIKINKYSILKHGIINNPNNLPVGMESAELKYIDVPDTESRYLLNLHSKDGSMHATAIYVGNLPKDSAIAIQKGISDLFTDSQYGKTVMVWHEGINGRERIPEEFAQPKINEKVNRPSTSYAQKGKL